MNSEKDDDYGDGDDNSMLLAITHSLYARHLLSQLLSIYC